MEDFFFSFQNQKNPEKQNKKRLTEDQVNILEQSFATNSKLEPKRKLQLANQLGVPPRQIAIWYQNKRARWKTQSLELDYNALQLKLESVMAEKRRLEKDVEKLKAELKKAQDTLISLKGGEEGYYNGFCEISRSREEGGSSGLHENDNLFWQNSDEVMKVDELYACFMGTNGTKTQA